MPTLLGVGVEYLGSAVSYFERMRQIEETAEQIVVLAGPKPMIICDPAASDGAECAAASAPAVTAARTNFLSMGPPL